MVPALAFERVTKRYDRTVVDDVSLTIGVGEFVALVGPSGSGKSTLLKTANRLVEPDASDIRLFGKDIRDGPAYRVRRRIGYVSQHSGLFPHMTVAQNIAIGARAAGSPMPDVAALLAMVDLSPDIATRRPDALSGGQRQRVGVARALATEPKLLLLDEPFGALDPITRDAVGRRVRALHDRLSLTTIMVTHDMAEALLNADRVVVMTDGRIVADTTPARLRAGDGGPEAQALVAVPLAQARMLAGTGA